MNEQTSSSEVVASRNVSAAVYSWVRDLHLYVGLAAGPFVLVFAVSAILFCHTWIPWGGANRVQAEKRTASFAPPPENQDSLLMGKAILRDIGVVGEIDFIRRQQNPSRLNIRVDRPGRSITVNADLAKGSAAIEDKRTGVWEAMLYLHARPGMHNASMRGNWFYMKLWGWVADTTVYLTFFLTASGIYMWLVLKAERRAGLVCLGAGVLTFFWLVWLVVG